MHNSSICVYFGSDHAGFSLKNELLTFVRDELGYMVEDCGAYEHNNEDDYPTFVFPVARSVAEEPENRRGIVLGASGQGEAMVANRVSGVRAALYYGEPQGTQTDAGGEALDLIASTRRHNDSNVLSLGARFITSEEAKRVVREWLETPFAGEERHLRRIKQIDTL